MPGQPLRPVESRRRQRGVPGAVRLRHGVSHSYAPVTRARPITWVTPPRNRNSTGPVGLERATPGRRGVGGNLLWQEMFVRMSFIRTVLFSALFAIAPAGLVAQQQGGIDPTQLPPEAQEMIAELQEVQAALQPIHQQAIQDPEVQALQQSLSADIRDKMTELAPSTPDRMARLQALMQQGQAAQAEQDQAALAEIATEARAIEQELQATQVEALQSPEIAPRVAAFEAELLEKMQEIDPQTDALIERAEELDAELAAMLGQGG